MDDITNYVTHTIFSINYIIIFLSFFTLTFDEKNLSPLTGFQYDLMIITNWMTFSGTPVYM